MIAITLRADSLCLKRALSTGGVLLREPPRSSW